jgi:hypothetical protein
MALTLCMLAALREVRYLELMSPASRHWALCERYCGCDSLLAALGISQKMCIYIYIYIYTPISWPPLWSSGQSSWLQIQRFRFDSLSYQIFWAVVGLERGPLSLVGTIEELLERKIRGSDVEIRQYGSRDPSRWPRGTLYPQKLALTSWTSGGRSVGIVCLQTQGMEFVFCCCCCCCCGLNTCISLFKLVKEFNLLLIDTEIVSKILRPLNCWSLVFKIFMCDEILHESQSTIARSTLLTILKHLFIIIG